MSEEDMEQSLATAVSEQAETPQEQGAEEGQKMVPLAAMLATRKKAQEAEARAQQADARAQAYEKLLKDREAQVEAEPDDPNALVEKHVLQQTTASTKREILETLYQDMNPEAVQKIEKYLDPILRKKPWLAASVDTALNRYARAHEIVQDYMHLVEEKPVAKPANTDGQKIVQNAQKPRSPVEMGRSAQPGGMEYLKSIQGKKEFREYRQRILQGQS